MLLETGGVAVGTGRFVHSLDGRSTDSDHSTRGREANPMVGGGPLWLLEGGGLRRCARPFARAGMVLQASCGPRVFVGPERSGAFELLLTISSRRRGIHFPGWGRATPVLNLLDVEDLCARGDRFCADRRLAAAVNATFNINGCGAGFGSLRQSFQGSVLGPGGAWAYG